MSDDNEPRWVHACSRCGVTVPSDRCEETCPVCQVAMAAEKAEPAPAVSPDEPARSPEFQVIDALAGELARIRLAQLESTTLANLLEQRDQRLQAQAMYFI
jgi:uncharacterized Zn finger protein (UPF0148 family)